MRLWGDSDYVRSAPPATPVSLIIVLVAALTTGLGIAAYRYAEVWTPLQRLYLFSYVRSAVALTTGGSYELWHVVDRTGSRLALDEELVTVTAATGETSFALSDTAVKAGATRLVWQREPHDHVALHRFLGRWIYHDQTPIDLAQPAFWGALALFLGGVIGAWSQDVLSTRAWRARYPAREMDGRRAPAIIDYVPSSPRSPAASGATADRGANHVRAPIPARLPASSTRAIGAGDATRPRGVPHASPASWPDPFFT
jgi:hypothetical protein